MIFPFKNKLFVLGSKRDLFWKVVIFVSRSVYLIWKLDDNFLSLALVLVGVEGAGVASEGVAERARLPEGLGEEAAERLPRPLGEGSSDWVGWQADN
jgi:hypothetical protein